MEPRTELEKQIILQTIIQRFKLRRGKGKIIPQEIPRLAELTGKSRSNIERELQQFFSRAKIHFEPLMELYQRELKLGTEETIPLDLRIDIEQNEISLIRLERGLFKSMNAVIPKRISSANLKKKIARFRALEEKQHGQRRPRVPAKKRVKTRVRQPLP